MTLEEIERAIHGAVCEGEPVASTAARLGVDPRRLGIYREMVRGHVYTALDANFDVLKGVLGEPLFDGLYETYLSACPPSSWALNDAAEAFPAFLERLLNEGRAGLTHFHVCLAELEWALYQTGVHPEPVAVPDHPTLNPTLTLLQTAYPVVPFMVRWQRGEGPALPEARESVSLLFQRPETGRACFYNGTDDLLFALKMVHDGLTAEAAAEATGHPVELVRGVLDHAVGIGLVLRP